MAKMGGHVQPPVLCPESESGLLGNPWHVGEGTGGQPGPQELSRCCLGTVSVSFWPGSGFPMSYWRRRKCECPKREPFLEAGSKRSWAVTPKRGDQ